MSLENSRQEKHAYGRPWAGEIHLSVTVTVRPQENFFNKKTSGVRLPMSNTRRLLTSRVRLPTGRCSYYYTCHLTSCLKCVIIPIIPDFRQNTRLPKGLMDFDPVQGQVQNSDPMPDGGRYNILTSPDSPTTFTNKTPAKKSHKIIPNAEEFKKRCELYFDACHTDKRPVQITGMILSIGLGSKTHLDQYNNDPVYHDTVEWAKATIEKERTEALLRGGPQTVGNIFYLKNHHGWRDVVENNYSGGIQNVLIKTPARRPVGAPIDVDTGLKVDPIKEKEKVKVNKDDLIPPSLMGKVLEYRAPKTGTGAT